MKLIYVCSPYRGTPPYTTTKRNKNTRDAVRYCREVIAEKGTPIAPHLFYQTILDDNNAAERKTGLAFAAGLIAKCDEMWVFGEDISEGMKGDIEVAKSLDIPIAYRQKP
jgi:hypothetical protein